VKCAIGPDLAAELADDSAWRRASLEQAELLQALVTRQFDAGFESGASAIIAALGWRGKWLDL